VVAIYGVAAVPGCDDDDSFSDVLGDGADDDENDGADDDGGGSAVVGGCVGVA